MLYLQNSLFFFLFFLSCFYQSKGLILFYPVTALFTMDNCFMFLIMFILCFSCELLPMVSLTVKGCMKIDWKHRHRMNLYTDLYELWDSSGLDLLNTWNREDQEIPGLLARLGSWKTSQKKAVALCIVTKKTTWMNLPSCQKPSLTWKELLLCNVRK